MPDRKDLTRAIIRDLISDIRAAERHGLPAYAVKCREELATLLPLRNCGAQLDRYGWPIVLKG